MPQNTTLNVSAAWALITDANVTEITFQNTGSGPIFIRGTNGVSAPNATDEGLVYRPNEGESSRALNELFPGVTGVNRVWARSHATSLVTRVFVSHA
jgi:hypothetical protein